MLYLIFYDIQENNIRTKISKRLEKEGYERIQFSVFLGIKDPKKTNFWNEIKNWLTIESENKFYVLKISKYNFKNMMTIGNSDLDIDYLIGEKKSLYI